MRRAHRRNGFSAFTRPVYGKDFFRYTLVLFAGVRVFAATVAGCTVAAAALSLPAALLGDPYNGQCKQDDQNDQRDDSTKCQHFLYLFSGRKGFRIQYTRFCPEGQREAKRKSVIFLKLGLAFWQMPCYNNHVPVRNAQSETKYGGLAQLVRAPASHAGGLGFESLILHHTVRTRTRFFTKKGSGTFFVYRRFCGESTQSGKQAKAGYHYDGGILPFVLRDQVRFVRTWSPPIWRHWG